jgi:hypothetical protein
MLGIYSTIENIIEKKGVGGGVRGGISHPTHAFFLVPLLYRVSRYDVRIMTSI